MSISGVNNLWDRMIRWARTPLFQPQGEFRTYSITAVGLVVLILILVIGFAAWESGTNLVYFLFGFLIAIFVAHGILSPRNLDGLQVERILPPRIIAGQPARITLRLRKTNRRRSLSLVVRDRAMNRTTVGAAFCVAVNPGKAAEVDYDTRHAIFQRRGLVVFDEIVVSSRFPFGTVERAVHFARPAEALVYPAVYPIDKESASLATELSEQAPARHGQGSDIYGLREYVPGEPMRRIHWKSSAKALRLMVMEFERDERRHVALILPNSLPPGSRSAELDDAFELAVSFTASLAAHLIGLEHSVGLLTNSGYIACADDRGQLDRILRALALLQLDEQARSLNLPPFDAELIGICYADVLRKCLPPRIPVLNVLEWAVCTRNVGKPADKSEVQANASGNASKCFVRIGSVSV